MFRFECKIKKNLSALYYVCSVVTYYHVYRFKKKETIRNGQRDITVKHTEKQLRQRNVGKCNGSENKSDTVKLSFLLN
jgi:hypothetical protein